MTLVEWKAASSRMRSLDFGWRPKLCSCSCLLPLPCSDKITSRPVAVKVAGCRRSARSRSREFVILRHGCGARQPELRRSVLVKAVLVSDNASFLSDKRPPPVPGSVADGVQSGAVEQEPAADVRGKPAGNGKRRSVLDYMESCPDLIKSDGGPPRWFTPLECGPPPINAPVLLFLPGMDGTGWGLVVQHQTLGRLFEVRCLHIPVMDRTPFQGLVKLVEDSVRSESKKRSQPIYIVGDSFGGSLALSVAARNPALDLVLILSNPATSFERSQLQRYLPLLGVLPAEAVSALPFLFSFTLGDPLRMAAARVEKKVAPLDYAQQLSATLLELLPTLPTLGKVIPRETLLWKLELLRRASQYANSRLQSITAQVLVLASGKDQMLPSVEEAKRLESAIPVCELRTFPDSGHTLLLEDGIDLATIIKSVSLYRFSRNRTDYVNNFVLPTQEEVEAEYDGTGILRQLLSPVFFSTTETGQLVRGLPKLPEEEVVIYVGNHSFMGLDLAVFLGEFILQRGQIIRGLAHPALFNEFGSKDESVPTWGQMRLFGGAPVSPQNMYKLLKNGSSILLYPGGAREATHRKGESHKLFWPEQAEFVRMAARFGATIVPFGVVGEDEIVELLMDLDDLRNIPFIRSRIENFQTDLPEARPNATGALGDQPLHLPLFSPKPPGRLYTLFGKPIRTKGVPELLTDRRKANDLYWYTKEQVEAAIAWLLENRKQDPYREFVPRFLYETTRGKQAPSFEL